MKSLMTTPKQSVRGQALPHHSDKLHGVGHKVDRVRYMDEIVAFAQIELLKLVNAAFDSELLVERSHTRIGIDSFGLPSVIGEDADRFAETAGDVEESSGARRERRESPYERLPATRLI